MIHPVQSHRLGVTAYHAVGSVDEALRLLAEHGDEARLIAGGTDLLLEMQRGVRPGVSVLIDVSRIEGFRDISVSGSRVTIGAGATHADIVSSSVVRVLGLPLAQACLEIGAPALRNRATVVGNIVTASPANDTITPLVALNARVHIASLDGERIVPLAEFHTGVRATVLEPGEIVTAVSFDAMRPEMRGLFVKLGLRTAQAISVIHLTVVLTFGDDDRTVADAVVALGSVAPTIVRASAAEDRLRGAQLDAETIEDVARLVAEAVTPIDDVRATAEYRSEQLAVMTTRTLHALRDGAVRWPDAPVTLAARHVPSPRPITSVSGLDRVAAHVNGREVNAPGAAGKTLLDWLRDDVGPAEGISLTGTKEGCAEGECGACTVMMDGAAVLACLVPAPRAAGTEIVTIEGLAADGELHPLQQAFVDKGAVQCGFCIPGFLMSGAALLEEQETPGEGQILEALSGNLCRCTGYYKIIEAFEQVIDR